MGEGKLWNHSALLLRDITTNKFHNFNPPSSRLSQQRVYTLVFDSLVAAILTEYDLQSPARSQAILLRLDGNFVSFKPGFN